MKRVLNMYRRYWRQFRHNWSQLVIVMIGTNAINQLLLIPFLSWLVEWLLDIAEIPYLSYTNIGTVLIQHPILSIELLVIMLITVFAAYLEFAFWFEIVWNIRQQRPMSIWFTVKNRLKSILKMRPGKLCVTILYMVFIVPFGQVYFQSALLKKIVVPQFILEDMPSSWPLMLGLSTFFVVAVYLAIKLITLIPQSMRGDQRQLVRQSWADTHGRFFKILIKLLAVSVVTSLISAGIVFILYQFQNYSDHQLSSISLWTAIINLFLLEIGSALVLALNIAFILNVALDEFTGQIDESARLGRGVHLGRKTRRVVAVCVIFLVGLPIAANNFVYLKGMTVNTPLVIAHRGVDGDNGVQNTIPVLKKTAKIKPDYVEMDVHETKDHQFVVMHDNNLANLTGVNKGVHDLTLKQLTKLTASENGYHAKVASFDDYLAAAEQVHQKLLVEIKTTNQDSPNMTRNFMRKYQARLTRDGDKMHSLSYSVVTQLKRPKQSLYVSYILPYNLTFPHTKANAYTMEETTLNDSFVDQAHAKHQQVLAWTVDDEDDMQRMLFLNVDGVITDDASDLQSVIKDNHDKPSYAQRLLIYTTQLNGLSGQTEN